MKVEELPYTWATEPTYWENSTDQYAVFADETCVMPSFSFLRFNGLHKMQRRQRTG
jgi:hypothetical protein